MRKLFVLALLALGCGNASNDRIVYSVAPIGGGKAVEVVDGGTIGLTVRVGDTVIVNIDDSECVGIKRELHRLDSTLVYNYVVKSVNR